MKRYKVPDHYRRGLRQAIGVGVAVFIGYLLLHGARPSCSSLAPCLVVCEAFGTQCSLSTCVQPLCKTDSSAWALQASTSGTHGSGCRAQSGQPLPS